MQPLDWGIIHFSWIIPGTRVARALNRCFFLFPTGFKTCNGELGEGQDGELSDRMGYSPATGLQQGCNRAHWERSVRASRLDFSNIQYANRGALNLFFSTYMHSVLASCSWHSWHIPPTDGRRLRDFYHSLDEFYPYILVPDPQNFLNFQKL